jgi:dTDP-4-dehydrorhamnose reductase
MILNKDTRVLITGCGGMLGRAVYEKLNANCTVLATDIDLNESWLTYCDVRRLNAVLEMVSDFKPDLLINLAALTDLEYCEKNPEDSWLTNGLGQENICLAANKLNIPVVYISTAGIFDGRKEFYHDFDAPNPLSVYGKSKYYGETITQNLVNKHFIFRAGWMMGGGIRKDKKFINKLFKQIKDGAKELFIVDDKFGTPTYTVDFANSIFKVVSTDFYGLYNMVCEGGGSRYDVALEFLKCLKLENKIKATIVKSDHFKKIYFAPRPVSEKLINLKLKERGILYMRHWRECLLEYSSSFEKELK